MKKTTRRSVVVPLEVIESASRNAPAELKHNFNRLTVTALRAYADNQKRQVFERQMAEMASDSEIRVQSISIAEEFAAAEEDGLRNDKTR